MAAPDEHEREIDALRDRTSKLSAAVLRVTASLDEATVLQEIVDSACQLTSARYGVITTIDDAGTPRDFVSSGFTPEQHREMEGWLPEGPQLFDHLRDLSTPLRLADLPSYIRSLGFSADLMPAKTFQGTPMRHRGVYLGSFFLGGKRGGLEFSDEDEDVLVLFASQAATAIANARTHRNEQRSRASVEALVETSPVGVVVFDVSTGAPTTFNREARRLVENLAPPGRPPEELIEILVCRFADGREVPMSRLLHDAPALRAEEVVLSVADGRGARALVNATTIRSAEGEPESMVVTMQDLAHLDELERLRTEFLSMVSHELRTPLTSIKGSAATVLGASEELDRSEMLQFFR
ncbi:MAG: GAF domain-containing protein, partial [Acidobacteria bacterium]|nr:GAF domain-containing protein [Acidobacteriota bacterium]